VKKSSKPTPERFARRHAAVLTLGVALSFVAFGTETFAALPPATSNPQQPTVSDAAVRQLVSQAQDALKSGNSRLALILMKNAVNAAPRNGAIRAQLGLVLLRTGDSVGAERELRQSRVDGAPDSLALRWLYQAMLIRHEEQKLLDEFPEPAATDRSAGAADLFKARALAYQAVGRPADALASMDHSLALHRDVPSILAKARLAEEQGNLAMAKSLNDEALALDPNSGDALMFKLGLLILTNDNAGAIKLSNQILTLTPQNVPARIARIEVFLKLRQDSNAKADVDAILKAAPGAAIGLYYKALLLARTGDFKGAWHIAQSLPPEFLQSQPSIAVMASQMAISAGDIETGASILSGALSKNPDLVDVRLRLAAVRLKQNSPDAALGVLKLVKDPNDPRVLAMLAQAYLKLKRYGDALEILDKLNVPGSAGVGIQRERALVEMQTGQTDAALKDLIELGAKQPTDPTVAAPLIAALVQAKRYPEALAAADRLGSDPKQRVQSYFFHGQVLMVQGDAAGALAAFQKALQIDPKHPTTLYFRAGIFEAQHKYAEASRDLQVLLSIDPKNVVVLVKLAEIAARQNQDSAVRDFLARAMKFEPKNPTPRIALARFLVARHDLKGALSVANDMAQTIPGNPDGLMLLGQLQLASGQKSQAVSTFHQLCGLLPRSADAQLLLANALFSNGDRDGAAGAIDAAANIDPNNGDVRTAQINLLIAKGDLTGAVNAARAFQLANPSTGADVLLADTLGRAKQFDQATAVLTKSLATKPDSRVLLRLVQLTSNSGDRKKAERLMADWVKSNPRDNEVRVQYGTFLMQDGDAVDAAAQYEVALKQDPNNVAALNNLAWLLQKNDPKRAVAMSELALKLSPNSVDVMDTLGWIKLQQKDAKGAIAQISHAHSLRPADGEITYHLVLATEANGDHKSAQTLLKSLLASGAKFDDMAKANALASSWH